MSDDANKTLGPLSPSAAEFCPSLGINLQEDIATAKACRPLNGFVNETGGTDKEKVDRLPGCNLPCKSRLLIKGAYQRVQSVTPLGSSGAKPKCSEPVSLPDIKAFLGVTPGREMVPADRTAQPAAQPRNTWEKIGCMDGYVFDLGNKTMWHDWHIMTNNNCHDFCAEIGFPYAATVSSSQSKCCAVKPCLLAPLAGNNILESWLPMHVWEEHEHCIFPQ